MSQKDNSSLSRIASELQSEPEQSLVFERFLPASEIVDVCRKLGHTFRDRVYTPVTILWMFLGQTLSPDHSCRDAIHRLNAWRVANGKQKASSITSSYCEARQNLPEKVLQELMKRTGSKCQEQSNGKWKWKGHDVKVIDGFTLTMPDTEENQKEYPQQKSQKPGCGSPIMRCVAMFCLATGAALDIAMGPFKGKDTGENSLLQKIVNMIKSGDILLADRYYATFGNIYQAYKNGYSIVMRSHHKRQIDFRRGFKQGSYDQVVAYPKPPRKPVWMSEAEYAECPDSILVRHVSYEVKRKGFRVRRIILATNLLDALEYSIEDLSDLYCRRWQVELDIRSLKTHMQMDHLRCQSPSMVRKEVYAHLMSYNLIRDLIVRTSILYDTSPKRLSHKRAVQALNAFASALVVGSTRLVDLEAALYETISEHPIGDRKVISSCKNHGTHPEDLLRKGLTA